jgi:acetyl esterase/lipase
MSSFSANDLTLGVSAIRLWPDGMPGGAISEELEHYYDPELGYLTGVHAPSMLHFPPSSPSGAAVVVCPGGGYQVLSIMKEGRAVAEWLNRFGVHVFVLKYRLAGYRHPAQLQDVTRALRMVRARALEWGINQQQIGVMGFSAGGHVAAMANTLFDSEDALSGQGMDAISARPDWAILVYPVICMEQPSIMHAGSRSVLLGEAPSLNAIYQASVARHVTRAVPPTFILHAADDRTVPVQNAELFHRAVQQVGGKSELHIFDKGGHGFGLGGLPSLAPDWRGMLTDRVRAFTGGLTN